MGTLTIAGSSATEAAGERIFGPLTIVGKVVIGETLATPLVAGDNVFNVPAGAVACLLVPPANAAAVLRVRTSLNGADGGLPISSANPMVYPLPAPAPASLIVNSSAVQSAPLTVAFI